MTAPDPVYWPPTLAWLKVDAKINDTRDDAKLQLELDAAVEYVEGARGATVDFADALTPQERVLLGVRPVTSTLRLGTMRLAQRWHARGRSPDGMVASPDLGAVRIGTGDADIDRMLRVGRYALPVIATDSA